MYRAKPKPSNHRLISLVFPEPPGRYSQLDLYERKVVALIDDYEVARREAAAAPNATFVAFERVRVRASERLAKALKGYGKGFVWGGHTYGCSRCGPDLDLTRVPAPSLPLTREARPWQVVEP